MTLWEIAYTANPFGNMRTKFVLVQAENRSVAMDLVQAAEGHPILIAHCKAVPLGEVVFIRERRS